VRLLKQQFERLDVEPEVAVGSLSEITNKRPAFCKSGSTEPIRIQKVSGVRSVAKKLKGRQEQHLANALNIFYRLFQKGNLQGSVLKLNERIWSGGMKEVDRIAEKARDVLIEYYMDCESIYNEGVQMVGQMVSPEAPVAVAATPTNQAPNKKLNVSAATVEGSKK
jgi:hypothetical protein